MLFSVFVCVGVLFVGVCVLGVLVLGVCCRCCVFCVLVLVGVCVL